LVSQVIGGTTGQIIGQKRRAAKDNGCPDRHLGLRLVIPLTEGSTTRAHAQTKPSLEISKGFRFKVTDSENNLPIPEATVSLFYWRRKDSTEGKKEIELKTDKNGIAEFPSVKAEKFAVSVLVKGYKPCWRWIRSNRSEELIRMRLEKWASTPK
jgi:hypothetical protein